MFYGIFILSQHFLLPVLLHCFGSMAVTDRLMGKRTKALTAFEMMKCEQLIWDFSQFPGLSVPVSAEKSTAVSPLHNLVSISISGHAMSPDGQFH